MEKVDNSIQTMTSKGCILIMDDEEIVREVVGAMLRHLGYEVVFAYNGQEALALYRERMSGGRTFDLVIMDLTIPGGMGGKDTMKQLLAIDPDARAIVSSGYSTDPVISDYASYGFAGVITKPFELTALNKILHDVFG